MLVLALVVIAVVSYLLGSVNGAIVASNLIFHDDIRNYGSHNAGLTNFYRIYGVKGVAIVLAVDIGKTALTLFFGKFLLGFFDAADVGALFADLCLVLGHMFPVFYQFRGGKGVMCAGIALFFIDWRLGVLCAILFVGIIAATRYVSLGSIVTAAFFPLGVILTRHGLLCAGIALIIAVLIIAKHWENILRLLRHEESKLVIKKDLSDKFDETF